MQDLGKIIETSGDMARVSVRPNSACGSCAMHDKCMQDNVERTMWVSNPQNGKTGDQVLIEIKPEMKLIGSAFVFLMPLAGLFLGYAIGYFAGKSSDYGVIGGISGLILFTLFIRAIDKFLMKKGNLRPVITQILH